MMYYAQTMMYHIQTMMYLRDNDIPLRQWCATQTMIYNRDNIYHIYNDVLCTDNDVLCTDYDVPHIQ